MIRPAQDSDISAITAIYNEAIANTTATFDTEPKSVENRLEWLRSHNEKYPVTVYLEADKVIGWGSLSLWSDKCAYADTVENSIYVSSEAQGRGAGKALLKDLIERARSQELHTIIARIADGNEISIKLHEQLGFTNVGTLKQVGKKFGRLINVHMLQLML